MLKTDISNDLKTWFNDMILLLDEKSFDTIAGPGTVLVSILVKKIKSVLLRFQETSHQGNYPFMVETQLNFPVNHSKSTGSRLWFDDLKTFKWKEYKLIENIFNAPKKNI